MAPNHVFIGKAQSILVLVRWPGQAPAGAIAYEGSLDRMSCSLQGSVYEYDVACRFIDNQLDKIELDMPSRLRRFNHGDALAV